MSLSDCGQSLRGAERFKARLVSGLWQMMLSLLGIHTIKSVPRKRATKITRIPKVKHQTHGDHYNLQEIYEQLNATYFGNRLKLTITWFGTPNRKVKSQRILGLYCFESNQIKVHRLLDHPHFPPYFVSYVIYHEMLHSVHPPKKKKRGRWQIHHGEFKQSEKCFLEYEQARNFEKKNLNTFFMSREDIYGRAQ